MQTRQYIAAVDIGTSYIRCHVYDEQASVLGHARKRLELLYPCQGMVEMNPDQLWRQFVEVIKEAVSNAGITFHLIKALGICTQRGTVLTWDKETGENFHNFVSWQCSRSADDCKRVNKSFAMMAVRNSSRLMYTLTGNARYLAGRTCQIVPAMVTLRLKWLCENVPELKERLKQKRVMAGCIGTWLLWKLTDGKCYGFEISLASSTGMFDPYVAGDQQAAIFGCACFDVGSVKISLGTGLFVDINTGDKAHLTVEGLHPLVGWKLGNELSYVAESFSHDAGSVVLWAQSIGLFDRVEDSCDIANSVEDSDGVYFVPAFSGLQVPVNDAHACACFIGLKASTTKAHMTRAVLEAIAFRTYQVFDYVQEQAPFELSYIRCVGGVAKNDFVCQMIADLCNKSLSTMVCDEVASLGVACLAGLGAGIWKSKDEIRRLAAVKATFAPRQDKRPQLLKQYSSWQKAVGRSLNWYEKSE